MITSWMISPTWKPKNNPWIESGQPRSHIITLVYVGVFWVQESEKWCKMDTSGVPETPTEKQFCCWSTCKLPEPWMVVFFHQKRLPKDLEKLDRMHMNEQRVPILKPKSYIPTVLLPMNKTADPSCLPTPRHDGSSEHFRAKHPSHWEGYHFGSMTR